MILMATCTLGLEGALSLELKSMGYKILNSLSGRVLFEGYLEDIPRLNVWMRTAERVILVVGTGKVEAFDELFDFVESLNWEDFIEKNGRFPVAKVKSVDSKLFSERSIQRIVKKAVAKRLEKYHKTTTENGPVYPIHVYLRKNEIIIGLDTTGFEGLHKRGYRIKYSKAPLRETIAASLLLLARYRGEKPLLDPFCGSGTIPIEAYMIAKNIPPGLRRRFVSEDWNYIDGWTEIRKEALGKIKKEEPSIICSDIDPKIVEVAKENAKRAGAKFEILVSDFKKLRPKFESGKIVTNPPYGKRIEFDPDDLRILFENFKNWEIHIISPVKSLEKIVKRKPRKKTTFFNSGVKVVFHQYY